MREGLHRLKGAGGWARAAAGALLEAGLLLGGVTRRNAPGSAGILPAGVAHARISEDRERHARHAGSVRSQDVATAMLLGASLLTFGWGNARALTQLSGEERARINRAIAAVGIIFVNNTGASASPFPQLRGSGVVVRQDGIVATNYHVIRQDAGDRLFDEIIFSLPSAGAATASGPRRYRLKPALINKEHDLALLRVVADSANRSAAAPASLPAIEMGDSGKVRLMDEVIVIGFPGKAGTDVTVNQGIVEGIDNLGEWIKTDARLMRGNSGGAAVSRDGKLIGIPSKVVIDSQAAEKARDPALPFAAVGFLRPARLVAAMLAQVGQAPEKGNSFADRVSTPPAAKKGGKSSRPLPPEPKLSEALLTVRGVVRAAASGKPIAGARVGLLPLGDQTASTANLIAWGGTDAEGRFEMNKRVPPGRYTLRAAALGYAAFTQQIEINQKTGAVLVEMRPSF